MLVHEEYHTRLREAEELFPGRAQPLVPKKAADLLQSHVISGFEAALEQGMHPMDALASILSWVSTEMGRVRTGSNS
jgi:hypothetical protein